MLSPNSVTQRTRAGFDALLRSALSEDEKAKKKKKTKKKTFESSNDTLLEKLQDDSSLVKTQTEKDRATIVKNSFDSSIIPRHKLTGRSSSENPSFLGEEEVKKKERRKHKETDSRKRFSAEILEALRQEESQSRKETSSPEVIRENNDQYTIITEEKKNKKNKKPHRLQKLSESMHELLISRQGSEASVSADSGETANESGRSQRSHSEEGIRQDKVPENRKFQRIENNIHDVASGHIHSSHSFRKEKVINTTATSSPEKLCQRKNRSAVGNVKSVASQGEHDDETAVKVLSGRGETSPMRIKTKDRKRNIASKSHSVVVDYNPKDESTSVLENVSTSDLEKAPPPYRSIHEQASQMYENVERDSESVRRQSRRRKGRQEKTSREEIEMQELSRPSASVADISTSPKMSPTKECKDSRQKKKKSKRVVEAHLADVTDAGSKEENVHGEGQVLGVVVHQSDCLKMDYLINHPVVKVHVVDVNTGTYVKKSQKNRPASSYYENETVDYIMPLMTQPFDFKKRRSVFPSWEELLLFNENYSYVLQEEPSVAIFFEIVDFVSVTVASTQYRKLGAEGGWHRIAWAFLKILGANQEKNTDRKLRLQLYKPPSTSKAKTGTVDVYQWWCLPSRIIYPATLYVSVKGIQPPDQVEPALRSMVAIQPEQGTATLEELDNKLEGKPTSSIKSFSSQNLLSVTQWSRLKGQTCKVPNYPLHSLPTARRGCMVVLFSPDGLLLACGCSDDQNYPIILYEIPGGNMVSKFRGHYGIIYTLDWSYDGTALLSASGDATVAIWDIQNRDPKPIQVLPHPSYVYCAVFHPSRSSLIATGCYDHVIRLWRKGERQEQYQLHSELDGHKGFLSAVCFHIEGLQLFSGDSNGGLKIWSNNVAFYSHHLPRKGKNCNEGGTEDNWTLQKEVDIEELNGCVINSVAVHPGGRRLLVHSRDNFLRMVDLRLYSVMQKYSGCLNFRLQVGSCITPCGSFIFSGSEDSTAYVWNTDTGDQVAMYTNLGYRAGVADVAYHPHDHMAAFCSFGENMPVHVYKYDRKAAQEGLGIQLMPVQVKCDNLSGDQAPDITTSDQELCASPGAKQMTSSMKFVPYSRDLLPETQAASPQKTQSVTHSPSPKSGQASLMLSDQQLAGTGIASPHKTVSFESDMEDNVRFVNIVKKLDVVLSEASRQVKEGEGGSSDQLGKSTVMGSTWRSASDRSHILGRTRASFQVSDIPSYSLRGLSPHCSETQGMDLTTLQQYQQAMASQYFSGERRFTVIGSATSEREPLQLWSDFQQGGVAVALYDYKAQRSDDISFQKGQVITVIRRDNQNWWLGELDTGDRGYFPANYVTGLEAYEEAEEEPESDEDRKRITAIRTSSGGIAFISEQDNGRKSAKRSRKKKIQQQLEETAQSDSSKKREKSSVKRHERRVIKSAEKMEELAETVVSHKKEKPTRKKKIEIVKEGSEA